MIRYFTLSLITFSLLALSLCSNWEQTAFNSLAAAQAGLTTAANEYNPCGPVPAPGCGTIPQTTANYNLIKKGQQAKDLAVNLMVAYEEAKSAGAASATMTADENAVVAALNNLTPIITSIQALIGTPLADNAQINAAEIGLLNLSNPAPDVKLSLPLEAAQ